MMRHEQKEIASDANQSALAMLPIQDTGRYLITACIDVKAVESPPEARFIAMQAQGRTMVLTQAVQG